MLESVFALIVPRSRCSPATPPPSPPNAVGPFEAAAALDPELWSIAKTAPPPTSRAAAATGAASFTRSSIFTVSPCVRGRRSGSRADLRLSRAGAVCLL